jgi:hypothetical protein
MQYRRLVPVLAVIGLFALASLLSGIATSEDPPSVTASRPANGATNIKLNTDVAVDLYFPPVTGNGVDAATLNSNTVFLYKTSDGPSTKVPSSLNTTGGNDSVNLTPYNLLLPLTNYTFRVTSGLKDLEGNSFVEFSMSFTTGTDDGSGTTVASFKQISTYQNPDFPGITGDARLRGKYASLVIGPDGRLYASMIAATVQNGGGGWDSYEGGIRIFDIRNNGTASDGLLEFVYEIEQFNNRSVIGLEFDPESTPNNPILWITSNTQLFYPSENPNNNETNYTGQLVRLTVQNHGQANEAWTAQTWVTGLPRSKKDHLANSLDLGPDNALYMPMGSQSAMGAPDSAWANRPESVLSGAVLRFDIAKMKQAVSNGQLILPLNVSTQKSGASSYNLNETGLPYNPLQPGAYVQIFATGVRNAYDLVWHTNGQLYVPTNGSAAGGNTPAYSNNTACTKRANGQSYNGATNVPALPNGTTVGTQQDYLFRVVQGGYYGHPNPSRCEWVLNGGNSGQTPTGTVVSQYPSGTNPDPNYRGISWDFGRNKSPNGVIEYRSGVFSGALTGRLLVVRYSANNDILTLTPGGANKDIINEEAGITGFTGFNNPLDLVEDTRNGNIYLSEYQDEINFNLGRIVLLKPDLNRRPISDQDVYVTAQNTPLSVTNADGVLKNDRDADGDTLTATLVTGPSHHVGTFTLRPAGGFDYTPEAGFIGIDTFTYRASDGTVTGNLASVTISVTDGGPNEPPVANADSYETLENQTLTVNAADGVLANDTDPNDDFLIAELVPDEGPTKGALTFNSDGSFVYVPNQAFNGVDTFNYRANDSRGGKKKATVTITVEPFNYPPEVVGETYYVVLGEVATRDVTRGLLKNDTDPNLDPLTVVSNTNPSKGTVNVEPDGSFTYTPEGDTVYTTNFNYTVSDGQGGTAFGTATINVVEAPLEYELLTNGLFENKKPSNAKMPMNWTGTNLFNDQIVCNTATNPAIAYEGNCAFRFSGNANSPKLSYLQQVIQPSQLEPGDTLTLSAYVKGTKVVKDAALIRVTVKYTSGQPQSFTLKIPNRNYPYTLISRVIELHPTRQVNTIQVRVIYNAKGTRGNFRIDALSLWKEASSIIPPDQLNNDGLRGINTAPVPLPPAPEDLRGSN